MKCIVPLLLLHKDIDFNKWSTYLSGVIQSNEIIQPVFQPKMPYNIKYKACPVLL